MNDILTRLTASGVLPYLIAAVISALLALSEIVSVFERDPVRALRTAGATLLIFINAGFAVLLLALVLFLNAGENNPYLIAVGVGFGLPILLRTNFTLIKPFDSSTTKGVGITFDEMYGRLQGFCRRRIDISLAARRVRTVDQAITRLSLSDLEQRLRLLLEGGLLTVGEDSQGFVDKILTREGYTPQRKQMLLCFGILNFGGDRMLEEMVKRAGRGNANNRVAGSEQAVAGSASGSSNNLQPQSQAAAAAADEESAQLIVSPELTQHVSRN